MQAGTSFSWDDAIDAVRQPIFLHDQAYRILRANQAYLEHAGLSHAEVVGRPYWECFPRRDSPLPACRAAMERVYREAAQPGDRLESREEIHLESGETFISRSYTVWEEDGRYRCSVHILEDVTDQRRMDRARRAAEAKVDAIASAARDAIVVIDDADRIVYHNDGFQHLFGYAPDELLGQPVHETLAPERYRPAIREGLRRFREQGTGPVVDRRTEIQALNSAGEELTIELSISPLRLEGRWHAVGVLRDVSERKALEEARERAHQDRKAFLAAISHDLRTPLNAVVGFTNLLGRTELSATQRRYIDLCRTASETLLGLIDTVLDLSRLEAGRVRLRDEAFDLHAFLESQIGLLQPMAGQRGLALEWVVDPDVPQHVRGDATRLGQVLYNLISNALKFTQQGSIRVDVRHGGGARVDFAVRDTGPGIPQEAQERIFEAFSQGGPLFLRQEGSGLGLKICRELVRLMGGEIGVESELGGGSTFHFDVRLPADGPDEAEGLSRTASANGNLAEAESLDQPVGTRLRVLVAEDDPTNAYLVQTLLEQAGCAEVYLAENGQEAVDQWQRRGPDLVLLDMQMPILDGAEAARRIRTLEHEQERSATPLVVLTAHALDSVREQCLAIGCDEYLTKPLDRAALWRVLAGVQGQENGDDRAGR